MSGSLRSCPSSTWFGADNYNDAKTCGEVFGDRAVLRLHYGGHHGYESSKREYFGPLRAMIDVS